jgi:hypothetical protein
MVIWSFDNQLNLPLARMIDFTPDHLLNRPDGQLHAFAHRPIGQ